MKSGFYPLDVHPNICYTQKDDLIGVRIAFMTKVIKKHR